MAAPAAAQEIGAVREGLKAFGPDELVWDFEDGSLQPPWGDSIRPHITSLGNYLVTSEGMDPFDVLQQALVATSSSADLALCDSSAAPPLLPWIHRANAGDLRQVLEKRHPRHEISARRRRRI